MKHNQFSPVFRECCLLCLELKLWRVLRCVDFLAAWTLKGWRSQVPKPYSLLDSHAADGASVALHAPSIRSIGCRDSPLVNSFFAPKISLETVPLSP